MNGNLQWQEFKGSNVDEAVDFLSEGLFPMVEAYSTLRVGLKQQVDKSPKKSSQGNRDWAAELSYRDFLFGSMVQATTRRLAQHFSETHSSMVFLPAKTPNNSKGMRVLAS